MDYIYYWRLYSSDTADGVALWQLNQSSPTMTRIAKNDVVWCIGRNTRGEYVLLATLTISDSGENPETSPQHPYGRYFFRADPEQSSYFDPDQRGVEAIIRATSLGPRATVLGQSFQGRSGVRQLTPADSAALRSYAAGLVLDPILSAAKLAKTSAENARLPIAKKEMLREYFARSSKLASELKAEYDGACQLCGARAFPDTPQIAETHHIEWLCRGGVDSRNNMIVLCPNHHALVHFVETTFDWETLTFRIGKTDVPVALNHHLSGR